MKIVDGNQYFKGVRRLSIEMVKRSLLRLILCCGFYIIIQSLMPRVLAIKRTSDLEDYLVGGHRTRRRNYEEQMALENEMFENGDDEGPSYNAKTEDPETTRNLPSFIVDYANMIRNDIILLDNSVETRTRKRGNIKVHNEVIPDPPCNCEYNKDVIDLGDDYYPRFVEYRNCSRNMCVAPYKCQSNIYDLPVLKKRHLQGLQMDLPSDLRHRWIADKKPVTIGCMCSKNYSADNRL